MIESFSLITVRYFIVNLSLVRLNQTFMVAILWPIVGCFIIFLLCCMLLELPMLKHITNSMLLCLCMYFHCISNCWMHLHMYTCVFPCFIYSLTIIDMGLLRQGKFFATLFINDWVTNIRSSKVYVFFVISFIIFFYFKVPFDVGRPGTIYSCYWDFELIL